MKKRVELGAWLGLGGWVCGLMLMPSVNVAVAGLALIAVAILPLVLRYSPYGPLALVGGQAAVYALALVMVGTDTTWLKIAPFGVLVIGNSLFVQGYRNEWALITAWIPLSQLINPSLTFSIDFVGPVGLCLATVLLFRYRTAPSSPPAIITTPQVKTTSEQVGLWFSRLDEAAQNINSNVGTFQTVIMQQSSRSDQQAATLQTLHTLLDSFGVTQQRSYRDSQRLKGMTKDNHALMASSLGVMQKSTQQLQEATTALQEVGQGLGRLALHMRRIGQVITLMNDLATQANFLAMNAQIEAARASDYGHGFVVVADEVRDLATQSRLATQTMKELVHEIQQAMLQVVEVGETGETKLARSVQASNETGQVMAQVEEAIGTTSTVVDTVLGGLEQQIESLAQLSRTVAALRQSTTQDQSTDHMVEHLAQTIGQLSGTLLLIIAEENL